MILWFQPSFFEDIHKTPDLPNGGVHLTYAEDGLYLFPPSKSFSASKAATMGASRDGCLAGPKKIVMKFHVNWGHASAQQLRQLLADPDRANAHLLACVDEVAWQCGVCWACDKAPRVPAG